MSVGAELADVVFAVTVTYGERSGLLEQVLSALLAQKVAKIVVVDNAAPWDVAALARRLAPERCIDVITLPKNGGPALGYGVGIQRACDLGAGFIWLLDDDNLPEQFALMTLMAAYQTLGARFAKDKLAVTAFRADHHGKITAGIPLSHINPRPSSFWNFHILDIGYQLRKRIPGARLKPPATIPELVEIDTAPFGGLLFNRSVVEKYGLPRADFVLYEDDTEFTYRITRAGGIIRLVTRARVTDLQVNSYVNGRFKNSVQGMLNRPGDIGVFYGARNMTFVDYHCRRHSALMLGLNRHVYWALLWIYAVLAGRLKRYRLLREAMRDGRAGRLGLNAQHPLPL